MEIYNYSDKDGRYLSTGTADESPLEPGVFIVPAYATTTPLPDLSAHEVAVINSTRDGWDVVADFAGTEYWLADGSHHTIDELGITLPVGALFEKPPEPLADVKARLADAVDDAIARIYARYTRFSDEYKMREAEALAFVAAGYTGTAGELVQGYAVTQPDMTNQQAAGIIIAQANALRAALTVLGNLRMRKNEIKAASVVNTTTAQAIHDEIIALAAAAVAEL